MNREILGLAGVFSGGLASSSAYANIDRVAVVIGNKSYQDRILAVKYAYRDADAIRRYVTDMLEYDPENAIDLRDASQSQPEAVFGNEHSHKGRIRQYIDPEGGSDVTIFYFGHGNHQHGQCRTDFRAH